MVQLARVHADTHKFYVSTRPDHANSYRYVDGTDALCEPVAVRLRLSVNARRYMQRTDDDRLLCARWRELLLRAATVLREKAAAVLS